MENRNSRASSGEGQTQALRNARARDRFKRSAWGTSTMVGFTQPRHRKGLNMSPKEAELEALAESKLERGDLAPLVRAPLIRPFLSGRQHS
jgi:hypothetical protein